MHILALSSNLFLLPFLYSIWLRLNCLVLLSGITYLCSVNYWRDPKPGWRLAADKIMSRTSYIVLLSTIGFAKYPMICHCIASSVLCFMSYNQSCKMYNLGNPVWLKYHIGMHICITYGCISGINVIYYTPVLREFYSCIPFDSVTNIIYCICCNNRFCVH